MNCDGLFPVSRRLLEMEINKNVGAIIRNTHDLGGRKIKVISKISSQFNGTYIKLQVYLRIRDEKAKKSSEEIEIAFLSADISQGEEGKRAQLKKVGVTHYMQGIGIGSSAINAFHKTLKAKGCKYAEVVPDGYSRGGTDNSELKALFELRKTNKEKRDTDEGIRKRFYEKNGYAYVCSIGYGREYLTHNL